jgi:hypothetical protein
MGRFLHLFSPLYQSIILRHIRVQVSDVFASSKSKPISSIPRLPEARDNPTKSASPSFDDT